MANAGVFKKYWNDNRFIKLNDKTPLMKFDEAVELEKLSNWKDVGMILPAELYVIDIDDNIDANKFDRILKSLKYKYARVWTNRGSHFIFKNNENTRNFIKGIIPFGILVDVKQGNSNCYIQIKSNFKYRTMSFVNCKEIDEIDQVNELLIPMKLKKETALNESIKIKRLIDGDGRNDALNRFKNLLMDKIKLDSIPMVLKKINWFVFDEPLPNKEINHLSKYKRIVDYKNKLNKTK